MSNKEKGLIKYLDNCNKVEKYKKAIADYDSQIEKFTALFDLADPLKLDDVMDMAAKELHNLRIKRLAFAIEVNKLEREILQFELAEELAD